MSPEEILKIFNVGDIIIINKEPETWSSYLCKTSPKSSFIFYPYKCEIKKIKHAKEGVIEEHVAMYDGKYGWDFSAIIKEHCIDINKYYRKSKLMKLSET